MNPRVAEAFNFNNSDAVRYVDYWERLTARSDAQLFARFLFAFMSVHTTWESNVAGFRAIRAHDEWRGDRKGLRTRLVKSGAGMHNNRAQWISEFEDAFWTDPSRFKRAVREPWRVYRDRLVGRIKGLGYAKVSFALELSYPLEAQVLCLDVHMLRLYGVKDQSKVTPRDYALYEADWVGRSYAAEMPPYIVKQMHWDRLQGRPDSRYWSHVLEDE